MFGKVPCAILARLPSLLVPCDMTVPRPLDVLASKLDCKSAPCSYSLIEQEVVTCLRCNLTCSSQEAQVHCGRRARSLF